MLSVYQKKAINKFLKYVNPKGKDILEVGSDVDALVMQELFRYEVASLTGINPDPRLIKKKISPKCTIENLDVQSMHFDDCAFDAVLSIATFEHILDLEKALYEIYRVLKPGGIVYSIFGPIWSSGLGHHVYAVVDDEEARFWKPGKNPLPDFSHLYMSEEKMRSFLLKTQTEKLTDVIVEWVYHKDEINRLFYKDYGRIFRRSPFKVLYFEDYWTQLVKKGDLEKLVNKFGPDNHYNCCGIEVVLKKERNADRNITDYFNEKRIMIISTVYHFRKKIIDFFRFYFYKIFIK